MRASLAGCTVAVLVSAATVSGAAAQTPAPARTPAPAPVRAPEKKAEPSPEAIKQGKALFARVVEGLGGREKVARVRDVQTRGLVTAKTPEGEMSMDVQTAMIFPDRISQQVDAPFGRLAMVATPAGAFIAGPSAVQDLPPEMKEELLRQVRRVPLLLAQHADDPKLTALAAGTEKVGEVEAAALDIAWEGASVRWLIDPKSGRILRSTHTSMGPRGEAKIVADYSDYKMVEGFPVAFHLEVETNGQKDQSLSLEECKINPGLDPKIFEKPALPTPAPSPPAATPAATPAP